MRVRICDTEYFRADDVMEHGEEVCVSGEVQEMIRRERARTIIDSYALRQNEAWSELGSKIVGAEGDCRNH